jgi:hypothetical protein
MDLPRLLRSRSEWHKSETNSESDREADQPQRHLGWDGWRESSRPELWAVRSQELAALVEHALFDHLVGPDQD